MSQSRERTTQRERDNGRVRGRTLGINRVTRESSSDNESDHDLSQSTAPFHDSFGSRRVGRHNNPKLPPFTGKEPWEIWFNRFNDIANRLNWSNDDRLDELLPRLQGPTGEFVYGQLSARVRSDYNSLCKELNSRFKIIETAKTFGSQFSRRDQKPGETVESYAAELKRLYDKAYPMRDSETRREDLLRRFLNGLEDDKARFHIDYIKDPSDIDVAVFEAVNFQETRRNPGHQEYHRIRISSKYKARTVDTDCERCSSEVDFEETEGSHHIARAAPGKNKNRVIKRPESEKTGSKENGQTKQRKSEKGDNYDKEAILAEMKEFLKTELDKRSHNDRWGQGRSTPYRQSNFQSRNYSGSRQFQNYHSGNAQGRGPRSGCFVCGSLEHFQRDCPKRNISGGNSGSSSHTRQNADRKEAQKAEPKPQEGEGQDPLN